MAILHACAAQLGRYTAALKSSMSWQLAPWLVASILYTGMWWYAFGMSDLELSPEE